MYYTSQTFTAHRFESKLLNSFGHPVPEVNGHLQRDATTTHAEVLSTEFTPAKDSITLDLTNAYADAGVKRLLRKMTYFRTGAGAVEIADTFETNGPTEIIESFPTHGAVHQVNANTIQFDLDKAHLRVEISAPSPLSIESVKVDEYGSPFTRVGVALHLEHSGMVTMRLTAVQERD